MRIINNVGYHEHTNALFLNSKTLKFFDLVDFQTAQIIYKARHNMLPANIQNRFRDRDGRYELRGELNLKEMSANTTRKKMIISVSGVKLWNSFSETIKHSLNLQQFKKRLKLAILVKYQME